MNYILLILFLLTFEYTIYVQSFKTGYEYNYNYESLTIICPSSKTNINITNPYFNIKAKLKFQVYDDSKLNEDKILLIRFQVITIYLTILYYKCNKSKYYFKTIDLDSNDKEIYSEKTKSAILNLPSSFEFDLKKNKISGIQFSNQDTSGSIMFKRSILDMFNVNFNEKHEVNYLLDFI